MHCNCERLELVAKPGRGSARYPPATRDFARRVRAVAQPLDRGIALNKGASPSKPLAEEETHADFIGGSGVGLGRVRLGRADQRGRPFAFPRRARDRAASARRGSALQAQARQRYTGRSQTDIAADLTANGFACEQGERVDCRIEIMERECAHDWYVVVERGRDPVAGYDVMCLGAR